MVAGWLEEDSAHAHPHPQMVSGSIYSTCFPIYPILTVSSRFYTAQISRRK
jgi:hypothetical protein